MWRWGLVALGLAFGCGGKDKPADTGGGDGDADTDTDTDSDTDTDTTHTPGERVALECPTAGCDSDPTGAWTVLGQCLDTPELEDVETRCDGTTVSLYAAGPDGTINFNATTYSFSVPSGGSTAVEYLVPESCNSTGCLNWETQDPKVQCSPDADGGCACDGNSPTSIWLDAGTWTRSGSTINLHSDNTGGDRTVEACATADSLWLYDPIRDVAIIAIPTPTQ